MRISALILTRNEESMIEDCIKQLNFVDEIIVLDQNSTDNTEKIARSLGAHVIKSQINQFDLNRNTLKDKSTGDWLLYVDADERFSEESAVEIKNSLNEASYSAYYFPRQNYVLGKWLKHGGWWPDYVPRLFKKSDLLGWEGRVHEGPKVKGPFGYMKKPIKHLTARSMNKMFEKSITWARIEAELYTKANYPKVTEFKIVKAMMAEFIRRYCLKFGVLDGTVGLIQAIFQSLHTAMVLTYIWEIQNKTREKFADAKI